MSFQQGNTFVYGEQPSASKFDQLWRNDDALQDWSAFDDGTFPAELYDADADALGFVELGRTTLGSAGNSISVTGLPARRYLKAVVSVLPTGGNVTMDLTFNGDTAANYAYGVGTGAGAADGTASTTRMVLETSLSAFGSVFLNIVNYQTREKTVEGLCVDNNASGAANIPNRRLLYGKWANTASLINRVDIATTSNNFAAGSEVVIYGSN